MRCSSSPGFDNDPSASSPTETLLRLLLPLNDKIQWTSCDVASSEPPRRRDLNTSPDHSIGRSDGRCVQRAEYIIQLDSTLLPPYSKCK
ncbi:hypothetical protein RHMOL_Rhmol11G0178400 [Rhododendron molle]|uniref:Uncharacterized protein n=1 Tax=Rhododendron molle TaxID=49168 RepID=A0ACC0LT82_RHOML|nr:hypothetical protein RHMOL_Rhmol11G0178400 [Rhododendron molle]